MNDYYSGRHRNDEEKFSHGCPLTNFDEPESVQAVIVLSTLDALPQLQFNCFREGKFPNLVLFCLHILLIIILTTGLTFECCCHAYKPPPTPFRSYDILRITFTTNDSSVMHY